MPDVDKCFAEVSILSSLSQHPNLVNFYGVCLIDHHTEEDDETSDSAACPAIQLEFCSRSLVDAVAKQRFSEHSAHFVMLDLFRGLEHIHELGLVHRDVKPEKVLLTSDAIAKLTGFGMSARLSDAKAVLMRCGTPGFAAPELLLGHKYGIKVDTFSSGALLYYIISGLVPFGDGSVESVGHRTLTSPVNFRRSVCLERLSDACKEFIEILLKKHPHDRPDSISVLVLMCCDSKDSDIRESTGRASQASTASSSTGRSTEYTSQSEEARASLWVDVDDFALEDFQQSRPNAELRVPASRRFCKPMFRKQRYNSTPGKMTQQHATIPEDTAVLEAPEASPEAPEDGQEATADLLHSETPR